MYDLEMMEQVGFCNGIENYSRHLSGRAPGEPPPCLLDYYPKNLLVFLDESHQTVPQIGAMYRGDRSRKETLAEYGFRLPSAMDNRPLKFDEFEAMVPQAVYVCATPGEYELQRSHGVVVEQVIRPTGLIDPLVEVRPARNQVEDLLEEVRQRAAAKERVLVTTLTKRMAEDLTEYFADVGVRVRYLHSDIDALERTAIIRDLRRGEFDVLVGINLLREGLDIPEVSLVAILDADKEGFLRSQVSLIQTIGRAARHVDGRVLMYADQVTDSMQRALDETESAARAARGLEPRPRHHAPGGEEGDPRPERGALPVRRPLPAEGRRGRAAHRRAGGPAHPGVLRRDAQGGGRHGVRAGGGAPGQGAAPQGHGPGPQAAVALAAGERGAQRDGGDGPSGSPEGRRRGAGSGADALGGARGEAGAAPGRAGRLSDEGRPGGDHLRRQGGEPPQPGALVLRAEQRHPRLHPVARVGARRPRHGGGEQREGGAPPRERAHQAAPAAVQRPAQGRQELHLPAAGPRRGVAAAGGGAALQARRGDVLRPVRHRRAASGRRCGSSTATSSSGPARTTCSITGSGPVCSTRSAAVRRRACTTSRARSTPSR